ncbi:MAG: phytase [Lysobacterales bacterium RIFOXYD1_FULL_69_11]|nr:MAG: phytase [Xanthomonadales bacterium RIFOXYA1_FULL_69_10]OHE86984.1 MAG: phytase [Xanthomonadales bacterium RIFOXYD1_FULL_69_11]
MTRRTTLALLAASAVLALSGCATYADGAPDAGTPAAAMPVLDEAFASTMTPQDNIDSLASWRHEDGSTWVFGTAKATDRLVVYDGDTGRTLRTVGSTGTGAGQFQRPNGVFVIDDLLFVVERDNRRVQVLSLPALAPLGHFGDDRLVKPYGLWARKAGDGYDLYVTDAYMAGEDAQGEDILPPFAELDERVKRFRVTRTGDAVTGTDAGAFGDTGATGALRVVESIWGDADNDRLLVAEEDETYANEFKVYGLDGTFSGRVFGDDVFAAQAEGIALYTCGTGGWWITTEQADNRTTFHLFERGSLDHVGSFRGRMVANTDGIWLNQAGTTRFPQGAFYAVHDDQGMVGFDWRDIARAMDLPACPA